MLKWIIELLKRIFMNNETTDRTTEDTNVDEKKIVSRSTTSLTKTTGAYFSSYDNTEYIYVQKADDNTYTLDGYFGKSYEVGDVVILRPFNYIAVSIDTGKILSEGLATMNSFFNVTRDIVSVTYRYQSTDGALTDFNAYRLLYSTKITEDIIW